MAVMRGTVVRVDGDGRPHVTVPELGGVDFTFGPCETAALGLSKGERVLVASIGVAESIVVVASLSPVVGYTDAEIDALLAGVTSAFQSADVTVLATAAANLAAGLATKAALAHTHAAAEIVSGVLAIARIPTGQTSTTVPLGNDPRFTDARTPTTHSHDDRYFTETELTAGALDGRYFTEAEVTAAIAAAVAAAVADRVVRVVYNTTTSSWPARPAVTYVEWLGPSPQPAAMTTVDTWINTSP